MIPQLQSFFQLSQKRNSNEHWISICNDMFIERKSKYGGTRFVSSEFLLLFYDVEK